MPTTKRKTKRPAPKPAPKAPTLESGVSVIPTPETPPIEPPTPEDITTEPTQQPPVVVDLPATPLESEPASTETNQPNADQPKQRQMYTGEDIVGWASMGATIFARPTSVNEGMIVALLIAKRYSQKIKVNLGPIAIDDSPAEILDALKIGEALAEYGFYKSEAMDLANAPGWARLLVGAGVLAFVGWMGVSEVGINRQRQATQMDTGTGFDPVGGGAGE